MLPAPPAVLILRALHLTVAWLLFATFGTNWWGPVRAIEQGNFVKEGHLTQFLNVLTKLHLHLYLNFGGLTVGASCLLMLPVTTYGACLPLLLWAILRLMSPLPAAETFDLAQVAIHKDWHFYRSVDTRDEW